MSAGINPGLASLLRNCQRLPCHACRVWADNNPRLHYIDCHVPLMIRNDTGNLNVTMVPDAVHPGSLGYGERQERPCAGQQDQHGLLGIHSTLDTLDLAEEAAQCVTFSCLADVIFTQCWGPEFGKLLANSQCKDAAAKTCTRGDGSTGRCEAGECKVSRHSMSARRNFR